MTIVSRLTVATLAAAAMIAYRRWHLTWGATPAEVTATMPGDELLPVAQFQVTRGDYRRRATGGCVAVARSGRVRSSRLYSYDLLDNLGRASATTLLPLWQHPWPGDVAAPMTRPATVDTAFVFGPIVENEHMVWSKPDSTWAWQLTPIGGSRTRLVTRLRQRYQLTRELPITVVLMELADFPMMRQMLRGIRSRAESTVRERMARGRGFACRIRTFGSDDGHRPRETLVATGHTPQGRLYAPYRLDGDHNDCTSGDQRLRPGRTELLSDRPGARLRGGRR